jgi:dTDP-4-amino-4,6-dideoxygalactose transaminase
MTQLALHGGPPAVDFPQPHEIWPPEADADELGALAAQRNLDIAISGSAGPIRGLENDFLAFLDGRVRYAVTFNSGTSALLAAYFAVGVQDGVEVVGPALTYHAALSPVYALKGAVVLVDIRPDTRCIDPDRIEEKITDRTRVITAVHQWGHPCEMDRIIAIAERYGLTVIEDCSHAHGSRYKGRLCGTFGAAAVFSLQANKAVFAGEGGILVTNSDAVHDRATLLGHYRDRARDEVSDPRLQRYWVTGFGLKLRMSPFNAIVARHSLAYFDERMKNRHQCLHYFRQRLADVDYLEPVTVDPDAYMGAWYGFKPLYRPEVLGGLPRADLIRALRAEGVEVSTPSGPCLATLPLYADEVSVMDSGHRQRPNRPEDYPVALDVERRSLSLPTFSDWARDRAIIDQYVDAFLKVGRHYRRSRAVA